jgi:hypothetical protein
MKVCALELRRIRNNNQLHSMIIEFHANGTNNLVRGVMWCDCYKEGNLPASKDTILLLPPYDSPCLDATPTTPSSLPP